MNEVVKPNNRLYVDSIFCNTFIENMCTAQYDSIPYYADTNHLSDYGSKLLIDELSKFLK